MFQQPQQQLQKFAPHLPTTNPAQPATSTDSQDDKGFRQPITFDGKRMRKAVMRKTVDYNSSVVKQIEVRAFTAAVVLTFEKGIPNLIKSFDKFFCQTWSFLTKGRIVFTLNFSSSISS